MNELLLILGMTAVTFGVRYPPLALVGRLRLPPLLIRALRYVPVAVLTAITVPELLLTERQLNVSLNNAYLVAGVVAILVAWRTKNLLLTIITGMGFFFIWRAVLGGL